MNNMNNTINGANTNKGAATNTNTNILGGMNMNNNLTISLEVILSEAIMSGVSPVQVSAGKRVLRDLSTGKAGEEEYALAVASLRMAQSNAIIDDSVILSKFLKPLKSKEFISFMSIVIKRDKQGKACGSLGLNSSPTGRAFKHCKTESAIVVPVGSAGHTEITKHGFAPYTKDLTSVQFKSENDLKRAQDDGIYIIYAGRQTSAHMYNRVQRVWENIVTGATMTQEELTAYANEIEGDLRLHKCFVFSPSDVRNLSYAATDVTVEDNRDEILDNASNGAWTNVKNEVEQMNIDGVNPKEIQNFILKAMPRFGQLKAGSANLGSITSWAYFRKAFETYSGETIDGTAYLRASYVAECFTKVLGINVSQKAVMGMFLQARPDMQKGAYLVIDDMSFEVMLSSLKEVGPVDIFGTERTTKAPVLIVDKNIVKLESNYEINDICFELLEIAAASPAHYSKQMHEKPLCIDLERAQDLAWSLGEDHISANYDVIINAEESIPTPGMVRKGYVADITASIAPHKILETPALMRSLLKNATQSSVNSVDKLKFSIEGSNARLISEYTELIVGKGRENTIVKYGEIWMPHAESFFKKKFRKEAIVICKAELMDKASAKKFVTKYVEDKMTSAKVCMIKYPSMGVKEYYLARPLTLKEIFTRIAQLDTTDEKKLALKRMFASQTEGVTMLPALRLNMFQCAGLDFDYDGGTFVYNQEYCDILATSTTEATCME